MSHVPREVALSGIGKPSRAFVEHGVPSLGGHVEGRSTGTMLLEEPMENPYDENFRGLDTDLNLGLKEEPESLLDYLCARRNRVMKSCLRSMPGLPLYMKMSIHNNLIFQLDGELTCHRSEVSELNDKVSK